MQLEVGNITTQLLDVDDRVKEVVDKICTLKVTRHVKEPFNPHPKKVEKRIRYFDPRAARVYSGIVHRVIKAVDTLGYEIDWDDLRMHYGSVFDCTLTLPEQRVAEADYSYQEDAVKIAECGRGILNYPTGTGKTIMMAKIIAHLKRTALIIVPSLTLLNQTSKSFKEMFGAGNVGRVGDMEWDIEHPIIVATQQSLYARLSNQPELFRDLVGRFDILFIDECHHVSLGQSDFVKKDGQWQRRTTPANSWWQVGISIPAYYRFGMSATVDDDVNGQFLLETVTGPVIAKMSISEGIERKVLVAAKVTMIRLKEPRYSSWKRVYSMGTLITEGAYECNILENAERNELIVKIADSRRRAGKRVLVLIDLVEKHGKILNSLIPDSIFLFGDIGRKGREEGLREFRESDGKVLVGTIFKEGFDCPEIDCLIIAGGGLKESNVIQKIGRVLRASPGKEVAEVWDFYDEDGSMCEKHSKARLKVYKREGKYEVNIVERKDLGL